MDVAVGNVVKVGETPKGVSGPETGVNRLTRLHHGHKGVASEMWPSSCMEMATIGGAEHKIVVATTLTRA